MPELAFIFLIGSVMSLLLSLFFVFYNFRIYRSEAYKNMQIRLRNQNQRWNDLNSSIEPLLKGVDQQIKEENKALNTYLLISVASVLLSWFGFFFLLLIWFSIKYLIKGKSSDYV